MLSKWVNHHMVLIWWRSDTWQVNPLNWKLASRSIMPILVVQHWPSQVNHHVILIWRRSDNNMSIHPTLSPHSLPSKLCQNHRKVPPQRTKKLLIIAAKLIKIAKAYAACPLTLTQILLTEMIRRKRRWCGFASLAHKIWTHEAL